MRVSFFHGLIILSILVLIDGVGSSVEVLSDNYIIKDGQLIHQYLVCVDSGSMSPDLNPGDLVVLENTSNISTGDIILYNEYGYTDIHILHRVIDYVQKNEPMWEGGPRAPFAGYITKGDHNEVIDQMAGQTLGMANMSYFDQHRDDIMRVGDDVYLDNNTDLLLYQTENGTYVGDGISYLVPVKREWVVGVAKNVIPYGSDWITLSPQVPGV
jgi:signal peptidase